MSPYLSEVKAAIQTLSVIEGVTAKVTPVSCPDGVAVRLDVIWGKGNQPEFTQLMHEIAAEFESRFAIVRDQLIEEANIKAQALIEGFMG